MPADTTFYRKPLPDWLIPLSSHEGRSLFSEALSSGTLESYFALAEQFHTQSEPAFCGLGTLVMVLNALAIDPGRPWKGPWRWYSEEMLDCCAPLDEIRDKGLSLSEVACLGRCNGARVEVHHASNRTIEFFREALIESTSNARGPFVVAAYSRRQLDQTGDGHYSPIAAIHKEKDLALLLDVARFKYPPHWVPISALFAAMLPIDPVTQRSRGFLTFHRGTTAPSQLCRVAATSYNFRQIVEDILGALPDTFRTTPHSLEELISLGCRSCASSVATLVQNVQPVDPDLRQALREELVATDLFQAIQVALERSHVSVDPVPLTLLVFALPDTVLSGLPHANLSTLSQWRETKEFSGTLQSEIHTLRTQLSALNESSSCRC